MREKLLILGIVLGIMFGFMLAVNVWAGESVYVDMYNDSYTVDDVTVRLVSMTDYPQPEYVPSESKELSPRGPHIEVENKNGERI